jgi:hypothetical protein
MGSRAGQNITTGSSNTGVGHNAFYKSGMDITYISRTGNVGIGATSDNTGVFDNLTNGNNNTAVGYNSVKSLTEGEENTIVRYNPGANLTTGGQNHIAYYHQKKHQSTGMTPNKMHESSIAKLAA